MWRSLIQHGYLVSCNKEWWIICLHVFTLLSCYTVYVDFWLMVVVVVVNNYHNTLCNNPEKQGPLLHSSRSLISWMIYLIWTEYSRLLCTTDTNYSVVISAYIAFWKRQGSIGIIIKSSKNTDTLQRNSALC